MCFVAASRSRLIDVLRILHYITSQKFARANLLGGKAPNGGGLVVEGAAGHPRSRDGAGRSESRLASRRARRGENHDGEVRFPARPSLREFEVALPSLHFASAIFVSGIPGFERAICQVSLLHHHRHTPHCDSDIFYPRVLSVSGRWSCPRTKTRIDVKAISLFVIFSGASRHLAPVERRMVIESPSPPWL